MLHLAGVSANGAEIGREAKHELNIFADEPRDELADLFDDGVEIEDAGLQDLHAAEREKLASQSGGAIGGAVDLFDLAHGNVTGR